MPLKGFGVNQRLQVLQLPDLSRSPTPMWLVYPFLGNREVADLSRPSADPRARACLLFYHGDVLGPFADIFKPPQPPTAGEPKLPLRHQLRHAIRRRRRPSTPSSVDSRTPSEIEKENEEHAKKVAKLRADAEKNRKEGAPRRNAMIIGNLVSPFLASGIWVSRADSCWKLLVFAWLIVYCSCLLWPSKEALLKLFLTSRHYHLRRRSPFRIRPGAPYQFQSPSFAHSSKNNLGDLHRPRGDRHTRSWLRRIHRRGHTRLDRAGLELLPRPQWQRQP